MTHSSSTKDKRRQLVSNNIVLSIVHKSVSNQAYEVADDTNNVHQREVHFGWVLILHEMLHVLI
jgi:hypothetical protein